MDVSFMIVLCEENIFWGSCEFFHCSTMVDHWGKLSAWLTGTAEFSSLDTWQLALFFISLLPLLPELKTPPIGNILFIVMRRAVCRVKWYPMTANQNLHSITMRHSIFHTFSSSNVMKCLRCQS